MDYKAIRDKLLERNLIYNEEDFRLVYGSNDYDHFCEVYIDFLEKTGELNDLLKEM